MLAALLVLPFVGQSLAGVVLGQASRAAAGAVEDKRESGAELDSAQTLISSVVFAGTGCPSGSGVDSALSADSNVVTLTFSDYIATTSPTDTITNSRENCQLNLNLNYPDGYQYSVKSAEFRGQASLEDGVTAEQLTTYYFSGQSAQTSTVTNLAGPCAAAYDRVDSSADASLAWSPCGTNAALNINSQIAIWDNSSSASTTDYINTNFIQVEIQWRSC